MEELISILLFIFIIIYNIVKAKNAQKKAAPPKPDSGGDTGPSSDPFEEIMRELKRKQEEARQAAEKKAERKKAPPVSRPIVPPQQVKTFPPKTPPKPEYPFTAEAEARRTRSRIQEVKLLEEEVETPGAITHFFEEDFDLKKGVIYQVILERKEDF